MARSYTSPETYAVKDDSSAETVIMLLGEYSRLLQGKVSQSQEVKRKKYLWICAYVSVVLGAFLIDFFVLKTAWFGISFVTGIAAAILPIIGVLYLFEQLNSASIRKESWILLSQLMRVLEKASTLVDHASLDHAKRFELDLRTTDAEITLKQAQHQFNVRSKEYYEPH